MVNIADMPELTQSVQELRRFPRFMELVTSSVTPGDHERYERHEELVGIIHELLEMPEQEPQYHDIGEGRGLWVVRHNTILSPQGFHLGGCRWTVQDSPEKALLDAQKLARGMTYKWAILNYMISLMFANECASIEEVVGSLIGGGKAVIYDKNFTTQNFSAKDNPLSQLEENVLRRIGELIPAEHSQYITAPDAGTSFKQMDYIARFARDNVVCLSTANEGSDDPSIVTAMGVYYAMLAAIRYRLKKENPIGLGIAIQGVGNVGSNLIKNIMQYGGLVNLIIADTNPDKARVKLEELTEQGANVRLVDADEIYDQPFDVFSPNAKGQVLNSSNVERMVRANPEKKWIIVGGANNQIDDTVSGRREEVERLFNEHDILYAPDFVVNLGGILNVIYEFPYVKKNFGGRYRQGRPLKVVEGVGLLLEKIFERYVRRDISTQRIAERMAEEHIARWCLYRKIPPEKIRNKEYLTRQR